MKGHFADWCCSTIVGEALIYSHCVVAQSHPPEKRDYHIHLQPSVFILSGFRDMQLHDIRALPGESKWFVREHKTPRPSAPTAIVTALRVYSPATVTRV